MRCSRPVRTHQRIVWSVYPMSMSCRREITPSWAVAIATAVDFACSTRDIDPSSLTPPSLRPRPSPICRRLCLLGGQEPPPRRLAAVGVLDLDTVRDQGVDRGRIER